MPKLADHKRPRGWVAPPLEEAGPDDIVLTHSEIEAYRQCPLKWMLAYKERWKIADEDREDDHPLTKGTLWHEVMERHYLKQRWLQNGGTDEDPEYERWDLEIADLLWPPRGAKQSDLQELVTWMYEGYCEKWGDQDEWEILGVEVKFQARLYDAKGNPTRYLVKGKLDLVIRNRRTQKIWIVDHKSGKDLPNELELDIADQFGVYAWLLKQAGIEVIGVIHSAARTTRNQGDRPENQDEDGNPVKKTMAKQTLEQRYRHTLLNRGAKELEAIAKDFLAVCINAYPEYSGLNRLPVYSSPDPRQCGWKCDFLEAHLMARKGRNIHTALRELGFEQHFEERY